MAPARQPFDLRVAHRPVTTRCLSVRGEEGINAPYRFHVRIGLPVAEAGAFSEPVLESSASLTLHSDGGNRAIHGLVLGLESRAPTEDGYAVFVLELVPRIATLGLRKRTRVFQHLTTPEIFAEVLNDRGMEFRFALEREYVKRLYCVQYGETDLAFIQRLLREEGIFYFFDHPAPGADVLASETIVLGDSPRSYGELEGGRVLQHRARRPSPGMPASEQEVFGFSLKRSTKPKGVLFRSFDMTRPHLEQRDLLSNQALSAQRSTRVTDPGRLAVTDGLTIYEHDGSREQARLLDVAAAIALEQERAGSVVGKARTANRRILPGRTFAVADQLGDALDGEYVVVGVQHRGRAGDGSSGKPVYENRVRCLPASVSARPERPGPRATVHTETAMVVGPPGQATHTDRLGRIKVQFHWDLDGKSDERSSCWLRVAQAWAGAGFGAQFVPRIGMEVLVSFLGGDPDRPIVTGCLYNGANPGPFATPEDAHKSGFRTRSNDGSDRYNELVFDDKAGAEEIYVRAQNNLTERVNNDRLAEVGANSSTLVGGDRTTNVVGAEVSQVGGNLTASVSGNRTNSVGGDDVSHHLGTRSTHVVGDDQHRIDGSASTDVAGLVSLRTETGISWDVTTADDTGGINLNVEARIAPVLPRKWCLPASERFG